MRLELRSRLHNMCFAQLDVGNSLFQFSEHDESNNNKKISVQHKNIPAVHLINFC